MEALKSYERQLKYRQTYNNNLDERLQANNRQNQKDEDLIAYERLCRGEIIQVCNQGCAIQMQETRTLLCRKK